MTKLWKSLNQNTQYVLNFIKRSGERLSYEIKTGSSGVCMTLRNVLEESAA